MREIGRHLEAEQNLTCDDVAWLVAIAQAILRAFVWDAGQPMRTLAVSLGISPQTLYTTLRLAVQALMLVRRSKQSIAVLVTQIGAGQDRLVKLERAYAIAQAEIDRLARSLAETQAQVGMLQAEVRRGQEQWVASLDRLIVVLKLSGRCTVRSIVEVLGYGLGVQVSVGYVQGVITQAGLKAHPAFEQLLQVVTLSGAICVDEVFFKEIGSKMLGVVIVDPISGLILRLQRCSDRSKEAIGTVLEQFAQAGFREKIKLCLTDMYAGYLKPVKHYLPQAVHQFCWFHINCFHIGATVHRAKRAYERAVKALTTFDNKYPAPLTQTEQKQRQKLGATCDEAQRYWVGTQRFQRMLLRALWSPSLTVATARLDQLIRVAAKVNNPYIQTMGIFLAEHRPALLTFYVCLEHRQHLLKRLSRSQQQWLSLTKRWAIPITTNAAEHVFRCLRRYTHQMDHFGTEPATQRFFDLFAFYYNVRILREGKRAGHSLLATSLVDVQQLFGSTDPYTILGFPPASLSFTVVKSVQSV